jgi:hypothetical protein
VLTHRKSGLPDIFFAAAHVQVLFFLLTNGVMGILFTFAIVSTSVPWLDVWTLSAGQVLLALAINTGVVLLLVGIVALAARRRPVLDFAALFGLGVLAVDFALLMALPMHVMVQTR